MEEQSLLRVGPTHLLKIDPRAAALKERVNSDPCLVL